jgi:hypothetical protein
LQKLATNYGPFVIIQYVCEINEGIKQCKIVKRHKNYGIYIFKNKHNEDMKQKVDHKKREFMEIKRQ